MRPLVAIDPGMNSMGWAYWNGVQRRRCGVPNRVGLIKPPRKLDLAPRALWAAKSLMKVLIDNGIGPLTPDMVSEYPAFHGSVRGWATGDLQKLAFEVGVMAGYFNDANSFTVVTPNQWKGQLPKDVVIRRLIKRFGPGATREWEKDMWDAVGIGMWKMGVF